MILALRFFSKVFFYQITLIISLLLNGALWESQEIPYFIPPNVCYFIASHRKVIFCSGYLVQ